LIVCRLSSVPLASVWRDWLLLLAAFWAASVFTTGKRAWTAVTLTSMVALMILYWWGQLPQVRWALDPALW
jgi:hypothetical protein